MNKEVEIRIFGDVQGVSYRYYTRDKAKELGLVGFVRNISDGSVIIIAQGVMENLQQLIDFTHKGSPYSQVKKITYKFRKVEKKYCGFDIIF